MSAISLKDILRLSVAERLHLLEEIWDSLAVHPESIPLTEAQKAELERRLADYRAHPKQGRSWEEVRDSLDES